MTKIMCTPYETRESWQMAATLHNETIYISEVETKENKERRENMDERQKEMCYWGYNFESYVTSPVDKSRLNNGATREESRPSNDSEAYITVIRTRLGSHSLVFGAEVDCCAKVCFLICRKVVHSLRLGGMVGTGLYMKRTRFESWSGTLCFVLGQGIKISKCL